MLRTGLRAGRPAVFRPFSSSCCRRQDSSATSRPHVDAASETEARPRSDEVIPSTPENSSANPSQALSSAAHATNNVAPALDESKGPSNLLPPVDLDALKERMREWTVLASTSVRQRTNEFSTKATTTFSQLGQHLNHVTGYEEIEALKKLVVDQEARIKATRQAAREAKTAYDDAVLQRSISQREVNDLLQRKSSWTDADVSNFTSLVRSDHSFEQEEARAKARVAETEDAVDREFSELMRAILARYHEEQVWSDKIRSASTYGSLAVLGVNLLVFVMAIIVVEPWKRKRLAQTFERKVEEMGIETKALIENGAARLEERLAGHERVLADMITRLSVTEPRISASFTPAVMVVEEELPQETPTTSMPSSAPWSTQEYPLFGAIGARELVLVAGSAVAGGAMTLLTRSLFGS